MFARLEEIDLMIDYRFCCISADVGMGAYLQCLPHPDLDEHMLHSCRFLFCKAQ